ncbi:hypothetical protein EMCRGX_G015611 [Ephydatia muelleri]
MYLQKVSRVGVTTVSCEVIASFHLDTKMGPVVCFSQNITWGVVFMPQHHPMLKTDGMMAKRVDSIARLDGLVDQGVNPTPVMGRLTARRMHVVRKLKVIVLRQQWRRLPTAD